MEMWNCQIDHMSLSTGYRLYSFSRIKASTLPPVSCNNRGGIPLVEAGVRTRGHLGRCPWAWQQALRPAGKAGSGSARFTPTPTAFWALPGHNHGPWPNPRCKNGGILIKHFENSCMMLMSVRLANGSSETNSGGGPLGSDA